MSKNLVKRVLKTFGLAALASLMVVQLASAAIISGYDTAAGSKTLVRAEGFEPNASVTFEILSPDGETNFVQAFSDKFGNAYYEIAEGYLQSTGQYRVSALNDGERVSDYFSVFSTKPSVTDSRVTSPGRDFAVDEEHEVIVKLVDDYGNPVDGHLVELFSADLGVEISPRMALTEVNGEAVFEVSSEQAGLAEYRALDLTADVELSEGLKVLYVGVNFVKGFIGHQDFEDFGVGNSSGPVVKFEFEDVPDQIVPGESTSFKLVAYDVEDEVVLGYDGTVRFSALGENANFVNLPGDYTFVTEDLGMHTFDLAVSFQQAGAYEVEVRDTDNLGVLGEFTFVVSEGGESNFANANSNSGLTIVNPVPGTYSNAIHVVSGTASPGARLKIFDNDVEIAVIVAGISGNYSFTTPVLDSGDHTFYVAETNEVGTVIDVSEKVEIRIDSFAPEIRRVEVDPELNVPSGEIVQVKLFVDDQLSSATMVINDDLIDMVDSGLGFYQASIVAPDVLGAFGVDFILTDILGNQSTFESEIVLRVDSFGTPVTAPGTVSGLIARAGDRKVTLNWQAPDANAGTIERYRVFYGLSPNQLTEAVDTLDASTTWYVPNLKNGVEYFFAVVALGENGETSPAFSNIVNGTPTPGVFDAPDPDVLNGSAGADALLELNTEVSETGPGLGLLMLLSLFGGFFYVRFSKKGL